jgi:cysteine-rich repeat protein
MAATTTTTTLPPPRCGDGRRDVTEACDDGNQDIGDGCLPDCSLPSCPAVPIDPQEGCPSTFASPCDDIPEDCGPADASCTMTLAEVRETIEFLAACEQAGRDSRMPFSTRSQNFLIERLQQFAEGAASDGSFREPFDTGTNILARIPGSDPTLHEVVVVGAHYDHLGVTFPGGNTRTAHGATDNAGGVAAVLAIGRVLARLPTLPRRSVILALWDAEELGLLGSAAYVAHPVVPLADTVAYVNFDSVGASPLRGWRRRTLLIGLDATQELGGQLASLVAGDPLALTVLGIEDISGRSDHENFRRHGVHTLFFTDMTGACYHQIGDDSEKVHFGKALRVAWLAFKIVHALADAPTRPTFPPSRVLPNFDDVVSIRDLLRDAQCEAAESGMSADSVMRLADFVAKVDGFVAAGSVSADDITDTVNAVTGTIGLASILRCQRN